MVCLLIVLIIFLIEIIILFLIFRANNEFDEDDFLLINLIREKFDKKETIKNRGDDIKGSFTYFIICKENITSNKITRKQFLAIIDKIGQTTRGKDREANYISLKARSVLVRVLKNRSKKDVIYGERITTKNINLLNLHGCKQQPNRIHIDDSIISFKQQNLLSISFFHEAYLEFINDSNIFDKDGNKLKFNELDSKLEENDYNEEDDYDEEEDDYDDEEYDYNDEEDDYNED